MHFERRGGGTSLSPDRCPIHLSNYRTLSKGWTSRITEQCFFSLPTVNIIFSQWLTLFSSPMMSAYLKENCIRNCTFYFFWISDVSNYVTDNTIYLTHICQPFLLPYFTPFSKRPSNWSYNKSNFKSCAKIKGFIYTSVVWYLERKDFTTRVRFLLDPPGHHECYLQNIFQTIKGWIRIFSIYWTGWTCRYTKVIFRKVEVYLGEVK